MNNRLYSATGAIWHSGPKKMKRSWGRTVISLIMLLVLSALAGWLLALVRGSLAPHGLTCWKLPGLATMPVPVIAMDGPSAAALSCLAMVGLGVMWVTAWVMKKGRKWHQEAAELRWGLAETDSSAEDPLALPAAGLNVEELRRILGSLLQQIQEARELVKRAQWHLSVEDYGHDLAHAHLLMGLAVTCLAELLARTDPGLKTAPQGGAEA